jgi:hypothetical protein
MDETQTGHEQAQEQGQSQEQGQGTELVVSPAATQDLVVNLRAAIIANIAAERNEPAQIALSRFAALIDQLSPAELDQVSAQVGAILPALTAATPNIAFVERAIANIGNTLLKARGGILGRFYAVTNGSPLVAVYFALVCSMLSFLMLFAIYAAISKTIGLPLFFIFAGPQFMTTVSFAFLGAMVSIAFRLDTTEIERVGLMPLYLTNLVKPYIGAMFGIITYSILQTKIITISGLNDNPIETLAQVQSSNPADQIWAGSGQIITTRAYINTFLSALVGFLSGFSERFATDLIDRSTRVFMGGSQDTAKLKGG